MLSTARPTIALGPLAGDVDTTEDRGVVGVRDSTLAKWQRDKRRVAPRAAQLAEEGPGFRECPNRATSPPGRGPAVDLGTFSKVSEGSTED